MFPHNGCIMSLPKTSTAYPSAFIKAISRAYSEGSLFIPHPKPLALRLQFQGLRGALRKEGSADLIDALSFHTQTNPPGLTLRLRETSPDALAIEAALGDDSPSPDSPPLPSSIDAESALNRILGNL